MVLVFVLLSVSDWQTVSDRNDDVPQLEGIRL